MLRLRHTIAMIELLSVLEDDVLLDLGLSAKQIDALDDVFEMSCGHYENLVGERHPLDREETEEMVDDLTPTVVVIPAGGVVH